MIAVLTHNYPESEGDRKNAGILAYDLVQELAKKAEVAVVCLGPKEEREKIGKTEVQWFGGEGEKLGNLRWWNPLDVMRVLGLMWAGERTVEKLHKESSIGVCLAMWAFPAGWWAYRLKTRFGIPYGVWALGSDIYIFAKKPVLGWLIKKILVNADFLFADGIYLAKEVERISGKKCEFLPSATKLGSGKVRRSLVWRKSGKIVLTFLGRMELVKGPDILLGALIANRANLSRFEVHFGGDGSLLSQLKERAVEAGVEKQLIFHGNINDPGEIARLLVSSDWVVIPSRSDSIPLVFSEAMGVGTPIVAAGLPDLKYLIRRYKVGYTFEPENGEELAGILEQLPARRKERAMFSRATGEVAKLFSIEESTKKLLARWESVWKVQ